MFKRWLRAVLLLAISACGHDDDADDAAPCAQMRDHLIELQLAETNSIDRDAHRAILARNLGGSFLSSCESSMSAAQIRCVLRSDDPETASACTTSAAGAP